MSSKNYNRRKGGGFRGSRGGKRFHDNKSGFAGRKHEKPEYRHRDQLAEEDVGIIEYISTLEGYSAVIKARYSDFQLNEINREGKMAKLTDISVPQTFSEAAKKYSWEETQQSPIDKIPQETWEALRNLVTSEEATPILFEAESLTKEDRTIIHKGIKSFFGQEIVASTTTKDGKAFLEFKKYNKADKSNRREWPSNIPPFVHFIVHKELLDTMDACFKISQALKIPAVKINYAGVKDRRSKSSQWFSIQKCEPFNLISRTKHIRNIKIGNIEFKDEGLKIGNLQGNRFRIALRNVLADDELITKSMEQIKEHGFINYYGMQRFGNEKEVPTYLIGIKLLKGQFEEAVNLILKVKSGDDPNLSLTKAKKLYIDTKDAAKALRVCDKKNSLERKLLEGLAKNGDYVNSLESIPRNVRLMYIHALQSLIWNKMVSKRIQEYGLKPVEGDLVLVDQSQIEEVIDEEEDALGNEETDEEKVATNGASNPTKTKPSVKVLTTDDLNHYKIYDIVLPLPGYDITYPENMKNYYKEALEEVGLTLEMPKQKVRSYSLSGTYRNILQRAKDFEWKIMYYKDPTDNLIRSDWEELQGEEEPKSVEGGQYKAVVLAFTLNSSSYATMVLREILKCHTSSSAQASLNNYGESESKPKIITETQNGAKNDEEMDEVQEGSLLADKDKYEDFKKNLFGDLNSETVGKRELEDGENITDSNKKIKIN